MSTLLAEFSVTPPSNETFMRIFQGLDLGGAQDALSLANQSNPHPSLVPVWGMLLEDGQAVGLATLYLPPPQSLEVAPAFIGNIVIAQSSQGKDMESYLLSQVEQWCAKQHVHLLAIQVLEDASPFFVSKGFKQGKEGSPIFFKNI